MLAGGTSVYGILRIQLEGARDSGYLELESGSLTRAPISVSQGLDTDQSALAIVFRDDLECERALAILEAV